MCWVRALTACWGDVTRVHTQTSGGSRMDNREGVEVSCVVRDTPDAKPAVVCRLVLRVVCSSNH